MDELFGQFFELFAAFNGLDQGWGFFRGDAPRYIPALLPDLMFEIRSLVLVRVSRRGPHFGLERTALHAAYLLHLLKDLLAFVSKRIHMA
jgi:hypothetical protein